MNCRWQKKRMGARERKGFIGTGCWWEKKRMVVALSTRCSTPLVSIQGLNVACPNSLWIFSFFGDSGRRLARPWVQKSRSEGLEEDDGGDG